MPNYRISIIIPAYNGERFLSDAIASAMEQTRRADEIIVVDDASTDATAEIAKSYGSKIKYYFNQRATGFVDAWNRTIEKATGDFVTILHQDDLLHPKYLYHVEKALKRYPHVKHIYTGCNYIDKFENIIKSTPEPFSVEPVLYTGKEYARNYFNGVVTNHHTHRCPGVTTSRTLLLNECTYRKEAGHIADDDFFLRVGAFTDVVGISQPFASYRHHELSTTSKLDLLTLRLAQDYIFQARYHKENNSLLDEDSISKLNSLAVKFINLLLFQSLLYKRKDWTAKAISLREDLNKIIPSFMEKTLPLWARIMWQLTLHAKIENPFLALYVKSLNEVIKVRNLIRTIMETK